MVAIGAATTMTTATVPPLWPGATVVCLAGGPSLTQEDVDACRDRARVIAVKDAIRLAPWADALYACDARWWKQYGQTLTFAWERRFALEPKASDWAQVLRNTGELGLERQPDGLRTGKNSGYQAINLAVHFGARRIVLLGYDMQPDRNQHHWFGKHPYSQIPPPYDVFLRCFPSIVEPLQALGVQVVNATRRTALTCFPRVTLEDALATEAQTV
jgi:hypothetical protein